MSFVYIPRPNYTRAQFKRLYRTHRQLQSPFFKGKKGDKDFFNRIFDSRTEPDETELARNRIQRRLHGPSEIQSETGNQSSDSEITDEFQRDSR